ncbi:MAG TPA: DUF4268 domain-containing protein [Anaerohalosphaeraceae bacterium]|nr:DUF4268 domain-containing protein [Anaerohalosphaeraceae bacterium]
MTPYKISSEEINLFAQKIIPLPEAEDYQIQVEKKGSGGRTLTVSQQEYVKFWSKLKNEWNKRLGQTLPEPRPIAYYQIPSGTGGIHFEWGFQGRPRSRFGVELHFEKGTKDDNLWYINAVRKHLPELEKQVGQTIEVMENWGHRWSRIFVQVHEGEMTEDLQRFAIEKMVLFYQYLQPKLDLLKKEYSSFKR